MPCFVIKRNPNACSTPWLGESPTGEVAFGTISDFALAGGKLKGFPTAQLAFRHIGQEFPSIAANMQVYELTEQGNNMSVRLVPRQ